LRRLWRGLKFDLLFINPLIINITKYRKITMDTAVKNVMIKVIQEQPDDSDFDEILGELAFNRVVNRGLADSDEGRIISHREMGKRITSWRK